MESRQHFDYIIVGQGLAGTCLSHILESKFKKRVFVIDRDNGKSCSAIAAGTFNPLVFKTFTPVWMAEEIMPYLVNFYSQLGEKLGLDLIENRSVIKNFKTEDQRKLWIRKSSEWPSSQWMEKEVLELVEFVNGSEGFAVVKGSGNIKIKQMLTTYRELLLTTGKLLEQRFNYEELQPGEEIQYGEIKSKAIIFCEGHGYRENPFFRDMPFKEAKGEVLIIRVKGWNMQNIINNNINIVPLGDDLFWVGSTFEWDDLTTEITDKGREELLHQLRNTISVDFEIIDQKAGIRPTVKDRRPILGCHKEHKNMFVFNGMGTRGVMLAPYFANTMAEYMENGIDLNPEVDISRFSE